MNTAAALVATNNNKDTNGNNNSTNNQGIQNQGTEMTASAVLADGNISPAGAAKKIGFLGIEPEGDASKEATPKVRMPRLVRRDLPFDQASNKIRVSRKFDSRILWLRRRDWFHAFLRYKTSISLTFLLVLWTLMLIVFALIYQSVDRQSSAEECYLGVDGSVISFGSAFAFALETCTTVGYGLPSGTNAFFADCHGLVTVIYLQMVWSMLFNAFLFAFLYNRLGRVESRGIQVIFSKKAIVSYVDDQIRFQVRIYDTDAQHPVVEAHVRLYAVHHARPIPRPLRLIQPNDELGGMLFLSMPSVVSHHVDIYSLLHPPPKNSPVNPMGLSLRQADSETAGREEVFCPICGESYGTHERWLKHVKFQRIVENKDGYPNEGTHLSLTETDMAKPEEVTLEALKEYFEEEVAEVVAVVEGIDPLMSGTFQAIHSYCFEDIEWAENLGFKPCMTVDRGVVHLNLENYHETEILVDQKRRRKKTRSHRHHDSFVSDFFTGVASPQK